MQYATMPKSSVHCRGGMEIVLFVVRYLFVATILVGGFVVLMALIRLAREKDSSQPTGNDS